MNYAPVEPSAGPAWELRNVPAIADEPRMPEDGAVAGRMGVHWNSSRSWSDVATWYHGLAAPRLAPTPPVQAKARELTANAADPIRALARFAQRDVRYVAVEIGIGGYQPHAAGEIFTNRFGDCKDKATLLRAMLKEVGVESYYVLVHTTRGMVDPTFPSVHAFNHVISAIRIPRERAKGLDGVIEHPRLGTLLLFDPTSTTTPFGQLPQYLQASRGLLVTESGGELIDLPAHAPESSALRRTAKLELDGDGTLRGSVEEVRTGTIASDMRAPSAAAERDRARALHRVVARVSPRASDGDGREDREPRRAGAGSRRALHRRRAGLRQARRRHAARPPARPRHEGRERDRDRGAQLRLRDGRPVAADGRSRDRASRRRPRSTSCRRR